MDFSNLHHEINILLDKEVKANPVSYTKWRNTPYQAYERIGFPGLRWSVEKRIKEYGLDRFFNQNHCCLDIGSNMGFFVVEFAHYFSQSHGVEPNSYLNEIGYITADALGVRHKLDFFNQTFEDFHPNNKYDVIFSLASFFTADGRQRTDANTYFGKIYDLLNTNGKFFYESTSYNKDPSDEIYTHWEMAENAIKSLKSLFRVVDDWETPSGQFGQNHRRFAVAEK